MTQLHARNIILPSVTFDPIYKLGRGLALAETILFHDVPQDQIAEVNSLLQAILSFISSHPQSHFLPSFVELSLFDPADPTGNRFYTLLAGTEEKQLDAYIDEMAANLDAAYPDRGAILPQESLYTAPYYLGKLNGKQDRRFEELNSDNIAIRLGAFEVKQSQNSPIHSVKTYITEFFEAVANRLDHQTGAHHLNTAILIPLYRPAAPIDQGQQNIFRGGGLFLFGHTSSDFNVDAFALELQSWLLKLVFEASHSQIEVEKLKFLQANLELGTYHHFSTNLRKIPGYLNPENFGMSNLTDTQIKKLDILSNSINYCIDNILSGLNSYKAFLNSDHQHAESNSTVADLVSHLESHKKAISDHSILHALKPQDLQIEVDEKILSFEN